MNILKFPNTEILAVLKEQPIFNNVKYRLMNHILIEDVDGGKLMFNSLTRCLVHIPYKEYSEIFNNKKDFEFLYRTYFIVPEDFEDMTVIDNVREHFKTPIDDLYLESVNNFIILTTTKCNARCFYCYELHKKHKKHMTLEVAKKSAEFIMQTANKNNQINLSWFGGEPLYNSSVIDYITETLRNNGYKYSSSFTTNAYLFNEELVKKAKYQWNTRFTQITLDGTEEIYNKVKNYIYNDNAYKKVLNNIALLLNNDIGVTVRLNIDMHNAEDLKNLVWECRNRFGNHSRFNMYAYPIFEDDNFTRTEEERNIVFSKLEELEKVMQDCGYFKGESLKSTIKCNQCIADAGDSILIAPGGDLGTCEHYIDSDFWGHLDDPSNKNISILKEWREYEEPWEGCKNCPLYGSCYRPKKCEEMKKCDERYKKWFIRKAKQGMLIEYRNLNNHYVNDTMLKIDD